MNQKSTQKRKGKVRREERRREEKEKRREKGEGVYPKQPQWES